MLALADGVGPVQILIVVLYLMVVGYLGWLGYRRTSTAADYMVGGRKIHPFVMALSYGATFISTSAIVGFGGVAGMFGMSLLWLTFLNIFVGIFIAFVFLGGPTRRMGHHLDAHTFPELIGRRFQSRFIQVFAGLVIFLFIPLYAAAVLMGGCAFIAAQFNIPYNVALLVFSVLIAAYVVVGGLKGVMYTDALQGAIMFIGMIILLVVSYSILGGVTEAHKGLAEMPKTMFSKIGHTGYTSMPEFSLEAPTGNLWWIVMSAIVLGVGIGVLAQPQLAVRFMTVKSKRELNRAVLIGGVFILIMTGVAFTVGTLSNLYFFQNEEIVGRQIGEIESTEVVVKKTNNPKLIAAIPADIIHLDTDGNREADTHLIARSPAGVPTAEITELEDGRIRVRPRADAYTRALVNKGGQWILDTKSIIPTYVNSAMPKWFGLLFLLTLLAAAMSTLSSQFHALGTAIGRDVYEQVVGKRGISSIAITRVGIIIGIVIAVLISYYYQDGSFFIARATAIFFGLCASAFLPTFLGGLFFRRITRPAAIASILVGFCTTAFWLTFIKAKEADAIGIVYHFTGDDPTLLPKAGVLPEIDPIVIALPLSLLTIVLVSFFTKKPDAGHLDRCFGSGKPARKADAQDKPAEPVVTGK
ncbi:MAG: sodium:solute symporter [Phycisphaerae bacterium]